MASEKVPVTVKDALRYTPLAVYPIQLTAKPLSEPWIESNPDGILHLISSAAKSRVESTSTAGPTNVVDLVRMSKDCMGGIDPKARDPAQSVDSLTKYLSEDAVKVMKRLKEFLECSIDAGNGQNDDQNAKFDSNDSTDTRSNTQKYTKDLSAKTPFFSVEVQDSNEAETDDVPFHLIQPPARLSDPIEKRDRLYDNLHETFESLLDDTTSSFLGIWKTYTTPDGSSYRVLSPTVLTNIDITTRQLLELNQHQQNNHYHGYDSTSNSTTNIALYDILQQIPRVFPLLMKSLSIDDWSNHELFTNKCITCGCILKVFRFGMRFSRPELCPEDVLIGVLDYLCVLSREIILNAAKIRWFEEESFNVIDMIRNLLCVVETNPPVDSAIVTKLEYLSSRIIFLNMDIESGPQTADVTADVTRNIGTLQKEACVLLAALFQAYPDQRSSILQEVLLNLEKTHVISSKHHQQPLKIRFKNQSIDMTTFLLLNFMEIQGTIDAESFTKLKNLKLNSSTNHNTEQLLLEITKSIRQTKDGFENACLYLVGFFVEKCCRTADAATLGYRTALDRLIKDLLRLVFDPLWPSACHLLGVFILFLSSPKAVSLYGTAAASSLAMDIIGDCVTVLAPFMTSPTAGTDKYVDFSRINSAQFLEYYDKLRSVATLVKHSDVKTADPNKIRMAYSFLESSYLFSLVTILEQTSSEDADQGLVKIVQKLLLSVTKDQDVLPEMKGQTDDNGSSWDMDYLRYLRYLPISNSFQHCAVAIERAASSSRITLRCKALRALASLIEFDKGFAQNHGVLNMIKSGLSDASTQARDISLDILSKIVRTDQRLIPTLYRLICDKTYDTGVAVRKRAIRVVKDLYLLTKDRTIQLDLAECILERIEDVEHSIGTLAVSSICEIVFNVDNDSSHHVNDYEHTRENDDVSGPDNLPENDSSEDDSDEEPISSQTSLLVSQKDPDVLVLDRPFLAQLARKKPDMLSRFFDLCLNTNTEGFDVSKFMDKECTRVAFETVASSIASSISMTSEDISSGDLRLLHIIISSSSIVLKQNQLRDLEYCIVIGDRPAHVINCILDILKNCIERTSVLSPFFLRHLDSTLTAQLKTPDIDVSKVVQCLGVIHEKLESSGRLAELLSRCLSELDSFDPEALGSTSSGSGHKIFRVLELTSYLAKYCPIDLELDDEKLYGRTVEVLMRFTESVKESGTAKKASRRRTIKSGDVFLPKPVRCLALKCVGEICIGHPKLFLRKDVSRLMDLVMIDKPQEWNDQGYLEVVLTLVYDLIQDDDRKVKQKTKQYTKIKVEPSAVKSEGPATKKRKTAVDFLHGTSTSQIEDSVPVGLVQRYLDRVLEACLAEPSSSSLKALMLVETAVRHGYAHPRKCVPVLMALESSSLESYVRLAKRAHSYLQERYASVVEGCYADSVKTVYQYQCLCNSSRSEESFGEGSLSTFYAVTSVSRNVRRHFMEGLVAYFQFDPFRTAPEDLLRHWNFTAFLARAISSLDFATQNEVLTVIQAIDDELSTNGTAVLTRIEEEDEDEPDPCVGISSGVLWMYWKLRQFLKELYNFSEAKCREYNPGKRVAREVKLVSRYAGADDDSQYRGMVVDLTAMEMQTGTEYDIKRIEQFVQTMKEEAVSKYEDFGLREDE